MSNIATSVWKASSPRRCVATRFRYVLLVAAVLFGHFAGAADPRSATADAPQPDAPQPDAPASPLPAEDLYTRVAPSVVTIYVKDIAGQTIGTGSGFLLHESELSERHLAAASEATREESDAPLSIPAEDEPGDFPIDFGEDASDETSSDTAGDSASDAPGETSRRASVEPSAAPPARAAFIITNHHVIEHAVGTDVQFADNTWASVERVIAEDEERDLALLAVGLAADRPTGRLRLASSDPVVFTPVYAIGSPMGLAGSASMGHVSSYRRLLGEERLLQTTAPISQGSSGGPLLLADGTVAGVTTLILRNSQNLNFAVPASVVREFLASETSRPRDIAEGGSLRWHEEAAFRELRAALERSAYSDTEADALKSLQEARDKLNEESAATFLTQLTTMPDAIDLADAAYPAVPDEFVYLACYVAGKARVHLAAGDEPSSEDARLSIEERQILYRESPHAQAARAKLEEAIKRKPDFAPAHACLALHHKHSGDWPAALIAANDLVRLMPRCAEALASRAECFAELGRPESVRQDLEAALRLSPSDGHAHFELAELLARLGEYDEAIDSYQMALNCSAVTSRGRINFRLGVAYRNSGDVGKAVTAFTLARSYGWPADECDAQIAQCQRLPAEKTFQISVREQTVYVTRTGTKYHREGCPHLRHSKLPLPLGDATDQYAPCAHCHPPAP